jgi:hypothetical protein
MSPTLEDVVFRSTPLAVDADPDAEEVALGAAEDVVGAALAAGVLAAGVLVPPPAQPVRAAERAMMIKPAPKCFFIGCSLVGARYRITGRR